MNEQYKSYLTRNKFFESIMFYLKTKQKPAC